MLTIERPPQHLVDLLYQNDYVYAASFNVWGDETLFVHKLASKLLDTTATDDLHKSSTRLMHVPPNPYLEAPKIIESPLSAEEFSKTIDSK